MGMAQPGAVASSLPEQEDEIVEEILEEGDEESSEETERENDEADARRQGWRPLAEYRGAAGTWVDAKTFLDRGRNYLPFVQKELRETKARVLAMTQETEGLRTEITSMGAQMAKLLEFSRNASKTGYDKAMRDMQAEARDAVAAGDVAAYDRITGQMSEMEAARAEAVEEAPAPAARAEAPRVTPAAAIQTEYQEFIEANPWFLNDKVLNSAMIAEHNIVMEETPGLPLAEQLDKAKESLMERFPKKFGIESEERPAPAPRRTPPAPLAPAPGRRTTPRGGDPFDAIQDPRERAVAKRGYDSAKRSMPDLSAEEYMQIFTDPHMDVLGAIKQRKAKK